MNKYRKVYTRLEQIQTKMIPLYPLIYWSPITHILFATIILYLKMMMMMAGKQGAQYLNIGCTTGAD